MKKKNGFTLVELLAVIVVLAIIMVIALPNVLSSMNKGKKESFYLYAKSMESKAIQQFVQDVTNSANADGIVYRIHKSDKAGEKCPEGEDYCIDVQDSGEYDGWVSVKREADRNLSDNDDKVYKFTINGNNIEGVYYCIGAKDCIPNKPLDVTKNSSSVEGSILFPKPNQSNNNNYYINVKYTTVSDGRLVSNSMESVSFTDNSKLQSVDNKYIYKVVISLRSDDYCVENFEMSSTGVKSSGDTEGENQSDDKTIDESQRDSFYSAMDEYAKAHKSDFGAITLGFSKSLNPKSTANCDKTINPSFNIIFDVNGGKVVSGSATKVKVENGGSAHSYDIGSIPELEKTGYTFEGWYYDKNFSKKLESSIVVSEVNYDSMKCADSYKDVTLYAKFTKNGTTEKVTSVYTAQTVEETTRARYIVTSPEGQTVQIAQYDPKTTADPSDTSIQLQSLTIDGYDIPFSALKYEYKIIVPNSVQSINVNAIAKSPDTYVTVSGNDNLAVGQNSVFVSLFNPNTNNQSLYVIKVSRLDEQNQEVTYERKTEAINGKDSTPDPSLPSSNASLKNLYISGYNIGFRSTVYEYSLELINNEEEIQLSAKAANPAAYVHVDGNKELKDGSKIVIEVKSQNGFYKKKYILNIVKPHVESGSTKILKYVVIGLIVVLAGLGVYISISRNKHLKPLNEDNKNDIYRTNENGKAVTDTVTVSDSGVQEVSVDNNKPLGPSDYVGSNNFQQPVTNVFNQSQGETSQQIIDNNTANNDQ